MRQSLFKHAFDCILRVRTGVEFRVVQDVKVVLWKQNNTRIILLLLVFQFVANVAALVSKLAEG